MTRSATNARYLGWQLSTIVFALCLAAGIPQGRCGETRLNGHLFVLPDGYEIEHAAGPPLVNRPISADFDDRGRLYVTDSSGSNENVKTQLEKRPHRIVRLEDSNGDGVFDKGSVFAEGLMFPEGALWHEGSFYVAAPPQIWKFTDTDDDGVCDEREVWFDGKTLTGCANDLHGPYLGPDGWIYWCKGAFAEQRYEQPGRTPFVTRAAHIFRRHPSGGPIEAVMTGGMDNPVEVVFTEGGERIFSTTFLQHPGNGLRDGLIHAVYGGVYGKVHGVLEGHPRTGPIMPVLSHLGAAAPCGLARLESSQLGNDYQHNVMACLFNMHKISRHILSPNGATFTARVEDFLVSDNLDFHPTDVLEDADGSLIVVDTGGWYKLCCPTSQLSKPDILGGIYRISKTNSHRIPDPRGSRIEWDSLTAPQLSDLLAAKRFAVRNRARRLLASHEAGAFEAVVTLRSSVNSDQRLQAVWSLCQIPGDQARAGIREALHDESVTVRQAALHATSLWRDTLAEPRLREMLRLKSAPNRRAAAEALGRLGTDTAAKAVVEATANSTDRIVDHSLIYAAIEIGMPTPLRQLLADSNPRIQRAALIALDQMPNGELTREELRPLLATENELLHESAWWVAEHRPQWATTYLPFFRKALSEPIRDPAALLTLTTRLANFASDAEFQGLMADVLNNNNAPRATRLRLLDAFGSSRLKGIPASWRKSLEENLQSNDEAFQIRAVAAAKTLAGNNPDRELVLAFRSIATTPTLPASVRLDALAGIPGKQQVLDPPLLDFLCMHLSASHPVRLRSLAVDVLTRVSLDQEQLLRITQALPPTGPMELSRLMERFAKSQDPLIGQRLVESLDKCRASTALPLEQLKQQLTGFGTQVLQQAQPLLARIQTENQEKAQKLEAVLKLTVNGDIRRGQRVFHNQKTACDACHQLGYLGGRVGPDLTRIGSIRTERDLLEAILFPSISFVRSYEPVTIVTVDGRVLNGVIRDETGSEVTLQLDAQKVLRLPTDEIEQRQPGTVSIMPAGLDKQLTAQQLADLVVFLRDRK
ncbi:MAG: PVC-type heme-binding CxxCH protein [Planctomycetota bacterium]|nr:PVC-type heme-binding CxxCH protein [Planctomycetota bacterium]